MSSGYIYLLGMENGKVKVGSSRRDPHSRIRIHHQTLGKVSAITSEWVSPLHSGYRKNERAVVLRMGQGCEIASADYEDILAYARSLEFPAPESDPAPDPEPLDSDRNLGEEVRRLERKRNAQILRWAKAGQTQQAIADRMGMSRQSVNKIIQKSKRREKVTT